MFCILQLLPYYHLVLVGWYNPVTIQIKQRQNLAHHHIMKACICDTVVDYCNHKISYDSSNIF